MTKEQTPPLVSASELIDHIDMMADEFKRIKALHYADTETAGLCDRAVSYIKQHVPVIEQRDRAEADRQKTREVVQALVDALKRAEKWIESAGRERFSWDDADVDRALSDERYVLALAKSQLQIEPTK
jgi:hypothetical protein